MPLAAALQGLAAPLRADAPALYLDFDGVLHPPRVLMTRSGDERRFEFAHPYTYHEVFEGAAALAELLEQAGPRDLQIIISSHWPLVVPEHQWRALLGPALAARVRGATWCAPVRQALGITAAPGAAHSDSEDAPAGAALEQAWRRVPRALQIQTHAQIFGLQRWIALDDDPCDNEDSRWSAAPNRGRLVLSTEPLPTPSTAEQLRRALERLAAGGAGSDTSSSAVTPD